VVTKDHQYWAREIIPKKGNKNDKVVWGEPQWVHAKDLTKKHYIGYPVNKESKESDLDFLNNPLVWWLIGNWWGDGSVDNKTNQISFYVNTRDQFIVDKISECAKSIGRRCTVDHKENNVTRVRFNHKELAEYLRSWKVAPSRKTPPTNILDLDTELLTELVDGYLKADGWETHEQRITSIHLEGLQILRQAILKLGHVATIRKGAGPRRETFPNGYTSISQQKYDIRWQEEKEGRYEVSRCNLRDGYLWSKVRNISETEEKNFIPITTPDHTYLTSFGKSHNCLDDFETFATKDSAAITEKVLEHIYELVGGKAAGASILYLGNFITGSGSVASIKNRLGLQV